MESVHKNLELVDRMIVVGSFVPSAHMETEGMDIVGFQMKTHKDQGRTLGGGMNMLEVDAACRTKKNEIVIVKSLIYWK